MDREEMLDMLADGYTPEYVSLQKWIHLRRMVLKGHTIPLPFLRGSNCALCYKYFNAKSCEKCTMANHFVKCNYGIWDYVYSDISMGRHSILMRVTDMINHLQYLVAVYGKYRRQE